MKRKENFKLPPGWPVRDGTITRSGKLGLLFTLLIVLLASTLIWATDKPAVDDREKIITTSNRLPAGTALPGVKSETPKPKPVFSPDWLSAKKPEGWVPPMAAPALTPYKMDWKSINGGGGSFGTSATRHLGYSVGQSASGSGSSPINDLCIGFWCGTGAACSVFCPPGAVAEGEPCVVPGADNFNGGCNSAPEVYSPIRCGDTICGTSGAESGTRDTDWYRRTFTSAVSLTWSATAEFPFQIFIIDFNLGCGGPAIIGAGFGNACDTARVTLDLSAGDYVFFISPQNFDGFACVDGPHDYVAWLDCCVECPPSGIAEAEACYLPGPDITNGGCNSAPPVFGAVNPGDTICGTTEADAGTRDTDWYQKVLTESTLVKWCAVGEFPILIGTIDGNSGCPVVSFRKFAFADSCDTAEVVDTLPPGTWWFFAATQGFAGFPCAAGPHNYTAWLTKGCLRIKGDMDGNTLIQSADVVLMLNCAFLGTGNCDPCFADVSPGCDGLVTSADVVVVLNMAFLGSPSSCPPSPF